MSTHTPHLPHFQLRSARPSLDRRPRLLARVSRPLRMAPPVVAVAFAVAGLIVLTRVKAGALAADPWSYWGLVMAGGAAVSLLVIGITHAWVVSTRPVDHSR